MERKKIDGKLRHRERVYFRQQHPNVLSQAYYYMAPCHVFENCLHGGLWTTQHHIFCYTKIEPYLRRKPTFKKRNYNYP